MRSILAAAISLLFIVPVVWSSIKAFWQKKYLDAFSGAMVIPFFVMFGVHLALGGSPAYDAETEYELYQVGHYYLVSHGKYTEVTQNQYVFTQIAGIIGWTSWAISFALACVAQYRKNRENTPKIDSLEKKKSGSLRD